MNHVPPSMPLRVMIVNDHPIVVAGLVHVMQQHPTRIRVVPAPTRGRDLSGVDIVLCDTFAGVSGSEAELAGLVARTDAKVVLFAGDLDAAAIHAALRAGVAAYVSKRISPDELVTTLESIHRGLVVTPPVFDGSDAPGVGTWPGQAFDLTSREAEVIARIALGHSNDEIARTLFLSINSVKTYIRTAYRKIGVQRRTQAVLWAIEHGFVAESTSPPADPPHGGGSTLAPGR